MPYVSALGLCLLLFQGCVPKSESNQPTGALPATQISTEKLVVFDGIAFKTNSAWPEIGKVTLDKSQRQLITSPGKGVLVSKLAGSDQQSPHLVTEKQYSDVSIKLAFNIPQSTHSGLFLLGRYRLNITDVYAAKNLWPNNMGGIHPRYDEERDWKNYDGVAPSANAAKPPGEWQTLEIDFKAPRFDEQGFKIAYAQFVSVKVNGVSVQTNSIATGPSRFAMAEDDVPEGPIIIVGGMSQIAIKDLSIQEKDFSHIQAAKAVDEKDRTPLGAKSGKPMLNLVELGKKVFLNKGCKECHEINPEANSVKTGPMLFNVFAPNAKSLGVFDTAEQHNTTLKADEYYFMQSLRAPNKHLALRAQQDGTTKQFLPIMPAFTMDILPETEAQFLYSYLLSLNSGANVGAKVVWQEEPEKPYVLSEDNTAELIGQSPRLVRVNIGENVSGRAYHVGLPNHMSYSFDPRTLAIEMVWSGRYLSLKNERRGRADTPSEPGRQAKIWPASVLKNLFQPILLSGQTVDFSFREPPKVNERLSHQLLAHTTDFAAEIAKIKASFIGVDTPPNTIPVFHYKVDNNHIALGLHITQNHEINATFDFDNQLPQRLFLGATQLYDISVSKGSIEEGVWLVPGGQFSQVSFSAKVKGAPAYKSMDEDPTFEQSNQPQPISWTLSDSEQQSLPAGYQLQYGSIPKDKFGRDTLFEPLGIVFNSAGDAYVSTRTAGVWKITDGNWQQFAEGVFGSLGLVLDNEHTLVIGEKPGLTRLFDADGDGWSERRDVVSDQFRFNSNYHEYLHGPTRTHDGDYLFTLNLGHGLPGGYANGGAMSTNGGYRGWAMTVNKQGQTIPFASGLRSPAGIATNNQGDVYYTDNQGDFFGTSKLFKLKADEYYGHPAGLVDLPGMTVSSPEIKFAQQAPKRALALGLLPHTRAMNSPGSPVWDESAGQFGPYAGQMFVGDQSQSNIFRVFIENIDGVEQSALLPFVAGTASGVMRMTFSPNDNSMWVGQTGRGWSAKGGSVTGLQRIVWDGKTVPQSMHSISVTSEGFVVRFTQGIPQQKRTSFKRLKLSSWYYNEDANYGSPELGLRDEVIQQITWAEDGMSIRIKLQDFAIEAPASVNHTSRLYEIDLSQSAFAEGLDVFQSKAWYTLNAIPKNDD